MDDSFSLSVSDTERVTLHESILTNLIAGVNYYFKVESDDVVSGIDSFETVESIISFLKLAPLPEVINSKMEEKMALTNLEQFQSPMISGAKLVVIKTTFDSSYSTGGEEINTFMATKFDESDEYASVVGVTNDGYGVTRNATTGKIQLFDSAGTEVSDTTNVSSVTAKLICIGRTK